MQRQGYKIFHLFSLTLIYLSVVIMLIGNSLSFDSSFYTSVPVKTERNKKVTPEPVKKNTKETVIKELSVEAVVPVIQIHLSYVLNLIFSFEFHVVENIPYLSEKPYALTSYFENTFGHIIAINAP